MGRKPKASPFQKHGILVLNKPSGPTSTDCLNDIKHQLKQFKIGHAGTLDPLAQGVLLVMLGKATKLGPYLTGRDKVYSGSFIIGKTTDTYDIQGAVTSTSETDSITEEMVKNEILAWKDLTKQEVPAYSAAKHKGKPLYELARKGEDVPIKIKDIDITFAEPLEVSLPKACFRVRCSAGTYIRSLVHSLGKRLGCGAVMDSLIREESEPFRLADAYELDDVLGNPDTFGDKVIPLVEALPHWPKFTLSETMVADVMNGARIPVDPASGGALYGTEGDRGMFVDRNGEVIALVEAKRFNSELMWAILRGLWN